MNNKSTDLIKPGKSELRLIKFPRSKAYEIKRLMKLLFIFVVLSSLSFGKSSLAGNDPISAAGFFTLKNKPDAPDFAMEDVAGNQVRMKDFRGKFVLLFFWTTW